MFYYKKPGDTRREFAKGETLFNDTTVPKGKELGEVTAFDSERDIYKVISHGASGGGASAKKVLSLPRKVEDPGTATALPAGTIVIIDWGLGFPYIDGVLNIHASKELNDQSRGILDISDSSSTGADDAEGSGYYRNPTTPSDQKGGDWSRTAPSGNRIGVFNGGYTLISAGPNAKARIELFQRGDTLRTSTENYELHTAMGFLSVLNEEGRCALRFRAAADQLTESGKGNDHWTFKLDIGDHGDFFNMVVGGADGGTKASVNITADGRVTILSSDGLSLVDGSTKKSHIELASSLIMKIMGDFKELVQGSVDQKYESSRKAHIAAADSRTVGGNDAQVVQGNQSNMIMGSVDTLIRGGAALKAKPTNVAIETHVLNGSVLFELGRPTKGANPLAKAGFTLAVNNGDIVLGINPRPGAIPPITANVILNTRMPGSVVLGGTKLLAPFGAVLYEPLIGIISAMAATFDSHIHNPLVIGPPIVPVSPVVAPLLPLARSLRVRIGA